MCSAKQIFLSYCHKDNETLLRDQQGWVQYFDAALTLELEQRGLDVTLWRDIRDIDKNDFWDKVIEDGLANSTFLIAMLSPNYVRRKHCLQELSRFLQSTSDQKVAAQDVYKVLIRPVPEEDQPDVIKHKEGFKFYSYDREKGRERLYYLGYGRVVRDEYWDVLAELGHSLENRLRGKRITANTPPAMPSTVYLAEVSADQYGRYRKLRHELEKTGYRVLPCQPLPTVADDARDIIRDSLAEAVLSVHLLGATAGFVPEGKDEEPIVSLQLNCAGARTRTGDGFRRLIWLPRELSFKADRQRVLVETILSGERLLASDELVREPFSRFLEILLDSLSAQETADSTKKSRSVYVLCRKEDEGCALDLQRAIVAEGFEAILPLFAADDRERTAAEIEDLIYCDGVIVVYCDERQERWVRWQLDRLRDWRHLGRDSAFLSTAVYIAGRATRRKRGYQTTKADFILHGLDSTSVEGTAFQPLLLKQYLVSVANDRGARD